VQDRKGLALCICDDFQELQPSETLWGFISFKGLFGPSREQSLLKLSVAIEIQDFEPERTAIY
jgi:hypothetical protein